MKDVIYLRVSRRKVEGMTKNLPDLHRGEIPVKVIVTVDPSAFREPVIERELHVVDWQDGVDLADVRLDKPFITEEEAELIRQRRLAQMQEILKANGYDVIPLEDDDG